MGGVGTALLLKPIKSQDFSSMYTWLMLTFAAKMLMGVGFLVVAWKVFEWTPKVSAFGMVGAYLTGLLIVTVAVMSTVKRGQ